MPARSDHPLIWTRPEPGDRRTRLTREAIARAALAIADSEGFEAVSMRRVAEKLGAGTMTLYHYVRSKDELVALMDDALMAEILVPEPELERGWREAMSAIARRTRAIYVRHGWALLTMRGTAFGPNAMRHFEQSLAALARTKLDRAGKMEVLSLVDEFVSGHALKAGEAEIQTSRSGDSVKALLDYGQLQLATGQFPHTAAMFGDSKAGDVDIMPSEERFERGLSAILDGVERWIKAGRAVTSKKPRRRSRKTRRPHK